MLLLISCKYEEVGEKERGRGLEERGDSSLQLHHQVNYFFFILVCRTYTYTGVTVGRGRQGGPQGL